MEKGNEGGEDVEGEENKLNRVSRQTGAAPTLLPRMHLIRLPHIVFCFLFLTQKVSVQGREETIRWYSTGDRALLYKEK